MTKRFQFDSISFTYTHERMYALHINVFIVLYLPGHYVKYISSCGQGQKKLDPLHQSMLLVRRYLGAFIPTHLPLFLDDSNHERVRSSVFCRATHMSFPPDLIYPVCSSLLIHCPWAPSQEAGRPRHLSGLQGPHTGRGRGQAGQTHPQRSRCPFCGL